jgi:hypothetical protein
MWTPRRISLALVGLLICFTGYFAYNRFLGKLDGLPPLPAQYEPIASGKSPPPVERHQTTLDRMLELAHGRNCQEIRFPIKLQMKKSNVIVASHNFKILDSGPRAGWVRMWPMSLAAFGQAHGADGIPEINTVYADDAYFRFDAPIKSMGDFDGHKIVAAEFHADPEALLSDPRKGRVRLINNRRTLDLNDDIEMVTPGPVYYEAEPKPGDPNIYTFTPVQLTDHLNTPLAEPDHTAAREPTMYGIGLRVFLAKEQKDKKPKKDEPILPIPHKEEKSSLSGVEVVGLERSVEMNLWTESNSSFVAPGATNTPKKDPKAKKDANAPPIEKRLLQIRTEGPFRYDVTKELAHFEKPAKQKPGLVEHVTVTRTSKLVGQDLVDCEFMDIQFQRKPPTPVPGAKKDARGTAPAPVSPKKDVAKKDGQAGDGDLEVKSIHAWGETVVITSDAENLHATGAELIHNADEKMTILRGDGVQQIQAVKDGNLLRGSEMHLYGDGEEITQAHVLGAGSIGMGEIDPKSREYQKQAYWQDRMLYVKQKEKDQPILDVFTFYGKDGKRAKFKDIATGELQEIEAQQLKVWLKPADKEVPKDKDGKKLPEKKAADKKAAAKKGDGKDDPARSAKPFRFEATGDVRSLSPDLVIRQSEYLNVWFKEVDKLLKPKPEPKGPGKAEFGPPPRLVDSRDVPSTLPKVAPPEIDLPPIPGKKDELAKVDPKKGDPKKEPAKKKIPFIVSAKTIEAWINRDPDGHSELDRVDGAGDVEAHQDGASKDELGTDIAGATVNIQAYADGDRMHVTGIPSVDQAKKKWGVVRFDKLTVFGFDTVIDQRTDTANVKGEGSMEILSTADMEGKKLDKPTTMTVYWKQKMDFLGADKLIYYHGGVQAYQEASRLKCEWMQVLLDRPVYLDQERRAKAPKPEPKPGQPKDDNSPKVDTVLCFHEPRDEETPKPKGVHLVTMIEEDKDENGKLYKFQSIQGPDVTILNTPIVPKAPVDPKLPIDPKKPPEAKARHDIEVVATDTLPGTVRIWQAGAKDTEGSGGSKKEKKDPPKKDTVSKEPPKKDTPKKKGELSEDEEMKLTVVQFAKKMIAQDQRKRAKFFNNVRLVHLPADRPDVPVDLREGEIPVGAIYMECRDTLEVFSTVQREKGKDGKEADISYQEMIGIGNVRVRKQGEFFGDADRVTYSELKGTMTFYGTAKNPAVLHKYKGQGVRTDDSAGQTIIYHLKDKTVETIGGTQLNR